MVGNIEKKFFFAPEEPIVLNLEINNLEVWVKTNKSEIIGFAKVLLVTKDNGEMECELTHFETSLQNNMVVARLMLSGILLIAENYKAKKIYASPHPVDFKVKEENVLSVDVYKTYQKLGFHFNKEDADITAPNQEMILII